ncbi:MAG: hypothetical protein JKY65_25375 [Planctomycetes bacterium]|nr:hypothetical protein [Planctomycetota bacterium]
MKTSRRSLTLIELLLVLTIMAALAASAASFVEEADDQLRYQDTQNRLTSIREAVLGRAGGSRVKHDGFLADTGRLPLTLSELLEPGTLAPWQLDPPALLGAAPPTGLGFGWRGPYLPSLPRISGDVAYPDGWGNSPLSGEPASDFGWVVQVAGTEFVVRSRGRDGKDGATPASDPYAADYPSAPLVIANDHSIQLAGWQVRVRLANLGASQVLKLRLRYFGFNGATASQFALLSEATTVPAGTSGPISFTFTLGGDQVVPWGPKAFDLVQGVSPDVVVLGPGNGPYVPLALSAQRVELSPRATLPEELPLAWTLAP